MRAAGLAPTAYGAALGATASYALGDQGNAAILQQLQATQINNAAQTAQILQQVQANTI